MAAAGLLGLIPLLVVAPPLNMSLQSVSGTYEGDLGGGREHLVLYPNGKFDQETLGASGSIAHANQGTWEIDDRANGDIGFHNLYMPAGFMNFNDPTTTGGCGASVRLIDGSIVFSEDENISLRRIGR